MKLWLDAGLEHTTRAAFFAYDDGEPLLDNSSDVDQNALDEMLRSQLATGSAVVVARPAPAKTADPKLRLISGAKRVNVALSRTVSVVCVHS